MAKPSLGIDQPGIYPVLVNVNGTPDYGAPARLDNARFLLPVVGVPPDRANELDSAVAPDTSKPVWITMLWPLADRPRLSPGAPGGTPTTGPLAFGAFLLHQVDTLGAFGVHQVGQAGGGLLSGVGHLLSGFHHKTG